MNTKNTDYIKNKLEELETIDSPLQNWRKEASADFSRLGLPTLKNEEWKYTGIALLFNKDYNLAAQQPAIDKQIIDKAAIASLQNANHLVFINGRFSEKDSHIDTTDEMEICSLEEAAAGKYKDLVKEHFGKSNLFIKDGIHALNAGLMDGGVFILIKKNHDVTKPIYFNHIYDTTQNHLLASPRSLVVVEENARVQIVESYTTNGSMDSFSNEVMEIVAEENAYVEYYKIQNDGVNASHTGTTHIRQVGKCYVHTLVVSLNGNMIRNNTNIIMEKEGNEAHMYGLYFLKGYTHVDNHTIVDNMKPNCFSNELYKGIIDDYATGVFSGKIYVRPDAQKINAYQTNNNILLSPTGTVNTKPQLEIYADDVKCSHGCTVGRLDEEALYYFRARGINEKLAKSMLLNAFAGEILEQIKIESLKGYVEGLIAERLHLEIIED